MKDIRVLNGINSNASIQLDYQILLSRVRLITFLSLSLFYVELNINRHLGFIRTKMVYILLHVFIQVCLL